MAVIDIAILRIGNKIRAGQKHAEKIIVKNCEKTVDNGLNMSYNEYTNENKLKSKI